MNSTFAIFVLAIWCNSIFAVPNEISGAVQRLAFEKINQKLLNTNRLEQFEDKVELINKDININGFSSAAKFEFLEVRPKKVSKRMLVKVALSEGKKSQTIPIWFKVSRLAHLYMTTKKVTKNKIFDEKDVRLTKADLLANPKALLALPSKELIWSVGLRENVVIENMMLNTKPLVVIGDKIEVLALKNGIKINTKGVALTNANLNENISVRLDYSSLPIVAKVISSGVARYEIN